MNEEEKIIAMLGDIDEITLEANLLALNTAIQAAEVGERGRSFAEVALNVSDLAQRGIKAIAEIKTLIRDNAVVNEKNIAVVEKSKFLLDEITTGITTICSSIEDITTKISVTLTQIDDLSERQATALEAKAQELVREIALLQDKEKHLRKMLAEMKQS